jgi:hypothetical protein
MSFEHAILFEWKEFLRSLFICGIPSAILFFALPVPALLLIISIGFWGTVTLGFRISELFLGTIDFFSSSNFLKSELFLVPEILRALVPPSPYLVTPLPSLILLLFSLPLS